MLSEEDRADADAILASASESFLGPSVPGRHRSFLDGGAFVYRELLLNLS
jgi:hypothetical protein